MNYLSKSFAIRKTLLLLFLMVVQVIVWAQDGSQTTTTTTSTSHTTNTTTNWYTQPWVWIIGAAVFILLLVALLKGSGNSSGRTDKVSVTKTVQTDTDTV